MKCLIIRNEETFSSTYIEVEDDMYKDLLSILSKLGKDKLIGVSSDIEWHHKPGITPLEVFLAPSRFIQIYGSPANGRTKVKIGKRNVAVDKATQLLTREEYDIMLPIWRKFKGRGYATYLEILEDPTFFDSLIVMDILK